MHRNNTFDLSQQTTRDGSLSSHNEEENNTTDSLNDNLISQQSNYEYDSDSMLIDPSATSIPTPSTPNNNFVVINDNEVNVTSQITQATNSSNSSNTSNKQYHIYGTSFS